MFKKVPNQQIKEREMGITLFAFETKKNITKNAPMETTIVASIPFKGIAHEKIIFDSGTTTKLSPYRKKLKGKRFNFPTNLPLSMTLVSILSCLVFENVNAYLLDSLIWQVS